MNTIASVFFGGLKIWIFFSHSLKKLSFNENLRPEVTSYMKSEDSFFWRYQLKIQIM